MIYRFIRGIYLSMTMEKAGAVMTKLRPKIIQYLTIITLIMMAVILAGISLLEVLSITSGTNAAAERIFGQVRQILQQNEEELRETQSQYETLCLSNARTIAFILENDPTIIEEQKIETLCRIAEFVQVDEIHIFDKNGVIFFGTQPQFYGYSFDSGEQLAFFKPMLADHSLEMVQQITPNTAEGRMVQYSALWSENEKFIVEIGMYPSAVLKAREKNEISYIFSLLKANTGFDLYAIEHDSGLILGCTNSQLTGKMSTEIGIPNPADIQPDRGINSVINGIQSYAVFTRENDMLIGYVTPRTVMYDGFSRTLLLFGAALLLVAFLMVVIVSRFVGHFVIDDIQRTNENLTRITEGDLDVTVDIRSSQEFSELSRHINDMVHSLVESRKQIEKDRDMDLLTDMYNRRGLDNELLKLEKSGEDPGYCAIIMIDADCLKTINDRYGHESGDAYLCRIAEALKSAGVRKSLCARQGGDEFVLFLYGYENETLLNGAVDNLRRMQNGHMIELKDGVMVEMQFSIGCSRTHGKPDYEAMLKEADAAMYADKRERHCRLG